MTSETCNCLTPAQSWALLAAFSIPALAIVGGVAWLYWEWRRHG